MIKIETKSGRGWSIKDGENFHYKCSHYALMGEQSFLKDFLSGKEIQSVKNGFNKIDESHPLFVALDYIVDVHHVPDSEECLKDDDAITVGFLFDHVKNERIAMLHDNKGNGLSIVSDPDSYPVYEVTHGDLDEDDYDPDGFEEDILYLEEHIHNEMSLRHYRLWKTFEPLIQAIRLLSFDENLPMMLMTKSVAEWKEVQNNIGPVIAMLPGSNMQEFLNLVASLENTSECTNEIELLLQ